MSETATTPRFAIRELSVLGYCNAFTNWHYKLRETPLAAALAPDFFRDAVDMFAPGDILTITGPGVAAQCVVDIGAGYGQVRMVPLAATPVPETEAA